MYFWKFQRFLLAVPGLAIFSGCQYEQSKPPTPEGLKLIKARTASGTVTTKLEARPAPNPARAGEISIWEFKVFDIKDKPTGERQEWKFFNPLPQPRIADQAGISAGTTQVLMRAWMISRDGKVFLPSRPVYGAYGTFKTDLTIPKSGDYTLFVRYQPAQRGRIFPFETARWGFRVAPGPNEKPFYTPIESKKLTPSSVTFAAYNENGQKRGQVRFQSARFRVNQVGGFNWSGLQNGARPRDEVSDEQLVALSPDNRVLVEFPPDSADGLSTRFAQRGRWKVWFSWTQNGEKLIAPGFLDVI